MLDEQEAIVMHQMGNVGGPATDEVVDRDHFVTTRQQRVCQVRADESPAPGDEYSHD